ncbi:MAG: hypothetical protein KAV82_03165 [Phycisphaerae bacterium]|nr:hypothetical protein [Phycisphaerae bacterium]
MIKSGCEELVSVVFADNPGEADECRAVLESHDIEVVVGDLPAAVSTSSDMLLGVPVLVPKVMHYRAANILADRACHAPGYLGMNGLRGKESDLAHDDDFEEEEDDDDDDDFDDEDAFDDDDNDALN